MRKRDTVLALRQEEALIEAWIGEITFEKQERLYQIRRRLQRIERAETGKQPNSDSAQRPAKKGLGRKTGK